MNSLETPVKPSAEDVEAFYAAQREINPDAEKEGLPSQDGEPPADDEDESPGVSILETVGEALDAPDHVIIGDRHVTVSSPCLDDLINMAKTLKAELGTIERLEKKATEMAEDMVESNLSALLRATPAARALFLKNLSIKGGEEFADDDAKWQWFIREIDAMDAIDIIDMFMARTDWVRLIGKVRSIMGKLQGLAGQARRGRPSRG